MSRDDDNDLRGAREQAGLWYARWEQQTAEKNAMLQALHTFAGIAEQLGEKFEVTFTRNQLDELVVITLVNAAHEVHVVLWEKEKRG